MPTAMTSIQIEQLRKAGIPASCDAAIVRVLVILDAHGVTVDWLKFVPFLAAHDPTETLKILEGFLSTWDPKP